MNYIELLFIFCSSFVFLSGGHTKGGRNKVKGQTTVSDGFFPNKRPSIFSAGLFIVPVSADLDPVVNFVVHAGRSILASSISKPVVDLRQSPDGLAPSHCSFSLVATFNDSSSNWNMACSHWGTMWLKTNHCRLLFYLLQDMSECVVCLMMTVGNPLMVFRGNKNNNERWRCVINMSFFRMFVPDNGRFAPVTRNF